MEKNPAREKRIYDLWKKGDKIVQIAEQTGDPVSTVGYYTKKFKNREKQKKYTANLIGPPIVIGQNGRYRGELVKMPIVDPQTGKLYDDALKPKIKGMRIKIEKTPIRKKWLDLNQQQQKIIELRFEQISNYFIKLMRQGRHTEANDLCSSFLSYFNLSQRFTDILQGRKKISKDDYLVFSDIFL